MPAPSIDERGRVVAVVSDLFFVARIRETARLVGVPVVFARTADEIKVTLEKPARLVVVDLTVAQPGGLLAAIEAGAHPPVLGFTTHALAERTRVWHGRCDRVVTKEALTRELPALLTGGLGR